MRYLFLLLTFAFTTELEVDGVIKANSGIDANNNPITNVGAPLTMSDAINGNILQDALRDDGQFEYKIIATKFDRDWLYSSNNGNGLMMGYKEMGTANWASDFELFLNSLSDEGWKVFHITPYILENDGSFYWNTYTLKRPIEENE